MNGGGCACSGPKEQKAVVVTKSVTEAALEILRLCCPHCKAAMREAPASGTTLHGACGTHFCVDCGTTFATLENRQNHDCSATRTRSHLRSVVARMKAFQAPLSLRDKLTIESLPEMVRLRLQLQERTYRNRVMRRIFLTLAILFMLCFAMYRAWRLGSLHDTMKQIEATDGLIPVRHWRDAMRAIADMTGATVVFGVISMMMLLLVGVGLPSWEMHGLDLPYLLMDSLGSPDKIKTQLAAEYLL